MAQRSQCQRSDFSAMAVTDIWLEKLSIQCESKNYPPPAVFWIFLKRLRIFNQNLTGLLHVHVYTKLQNFIQLPPTLTKLSRIKHDHPVNFYISQHIYHKFY